MWLLPVFKRRPIQGLKLTTAQFAVLALLIVVFVLALASLAYAGTFSRYLADDYCFSRLTIENGFWGAQVKSYNTWSDRFSATLVASVVDVAGVIGIRFLPLVLIAALAAGSVGTIQRIRKACNLPITSLEAYILGLLFSLSVLSTAPSQYQSLFWRAGSITYLLPLVVFPFLGWIIFSHPSGWRKPAGYVLAGLVGFLNAGFSETTLALQWFLVGIAILLTFKLQSRDADGPVNRKLLWVVLGATLVATVFMLASPGNTVRMGAMDKQPDLIRGALLSVRYVLAFGYHTLQSSWLSLGVTALFMLSLAFQRDWSETNPSGLYWLLWAILLGTLLALIACCAPSAIMQGAYPEDRALLAAQWVLFLGWMSWFYLAGILWIHSRQKKTAFTLKPYLSNGLFLLVIFCFFFMFVTLGTLSGIPALQERAQAWDLRAADIQQQKAQGLPDVQVAALDSVERIKELDEDPGHWVNKCAAVYYGVETISAK